MLGLKLLSKVLNTERPEVHADRCVRKFRRATCESCRRDCPAQAITLATSPRVDEVRCTGCGVCANVCPTGAFVAPTVDVKAVHFGAVDADFACSMAPAVQRSVIRVPCLGSLSEGALLAALTRRGGLSLDVSQCKTCPSGLALGIIERTVACANTILSSFGIEKSIGLDSSVRQSPATEQRSRREFLAYLRGGATKAAAQSVGLILGDTLGRSGPVEMSAGEIPVKHMLLQLQIEALVLSTSGNCVAFALPYGGPLPPTSCELCGVCALACPSRALSVREDDGVWQLVLERANCLDCGLCSVVCPHSVLPYASSINASAMVNGECAVLIQAGKITCVSCGVLFANLESDTVCPSCRKDKDVGNFFGFGALAKGIGGGKEL